MQADKLKAFATHGPHPKGQSIKGKPPATHTSPAPEPPHEEPDGDEDPESTDDMAEGGKGKFGELIPQLEAVASQIGELTDEFDPEVLSDTDEALEGEDATALQEGIDRLPAEFTDAFAKATDGDGITTDEARQLTQHLVDEDLVDVDEDLIAGWLYHAAKVV